MAPRADTAPRGDGTFADADRAEAEAEAGAVSVSVVSASAMGEASAEPTPSIIARAPTRPTERYMDALGMPLLAGTT